MGFAYWIYFVKVGNNLLRSSADVWQSVTLIIMARLKPDTRTVEVRARTYEEAKSFIRAYGLSLRPRRDEAALVRMALNEFFSHPARRAKVAAIGEWPTL